MTFELPRSVRLPKALDPPTLFYKAGDSEVGLNILENKIALSIDPEQDVALPGNLTFERQLRGNLAVYTLASETSAQPALSLESLRQIDGIEFTTPVFYNAESGSELVATNEVIVALNAGQTADEFFSSNAEYASFRPLRGSTNQFVATLADGYGTATLEAANKALNEGKVEWATPNFYSDIQKFYTPNDPRFGNQWHLRNTGQGGGLVGADANLTAAWDVNQGGSASIVVGVIDDAVDFHEDLLLFTNPGEIPDNDLDDDGNGWVDDVHGWNFVSDNNVSTPTTADDNHGTAVAGVAAARGDNNVGLVGASYNSPVIAARIFEGDNVASDANIAEALRYMAGFTANGLGTWRSADIVNNSWGGGPNSPAINSALSDGTTLGRQGLGTPYFFATGNSGVGFVSQPAAQAANIPGVFGIGATNNFGERSAYSQFGTGLDFVTPSNDFRAGYLAIDTTDREGAAGYNTSIVGNYTGTGATGFGGTSSATPLATGIAALTIAELEANGINLSPAELREYLRVNTDLIGGVAYDPLTGWNPEFGWGRLDAGAALANIGKAEISVLSSTEDLESSVSEVDLGSAVVGLASTQATIRIRNQGTEPLSLTSLSIDSGPFSIASGFGSSLLEVGDATTFVVEFTPTTSGEATGSVTITNDDADESSFVVNLRGLGLVASASGFVFEDHDANGVAAPNEIPIANSIAYLDLNNNSQLDGYTSFETTTPVNIADFTEVFSPLEVIGVAQPVAGIVVEVDISHTFTSDLDLVLIAPDGSRLLLASEVGGSGDNFTDTVFDDLAEASITSGTAPFTGSFRPQQPLSNLLGVDPNGTWQLSVQDFAAGDVGQILGWSIEFEAEVSEPFVSSDTLGSFAFFNLPIGDYTLRSEAPEGWSNSTEVSYEFSIDNPDDAFPGSNFGIGKDNRFYGFVFDDINGDGVQDAGEVSLSDWEIFLDENGNGMRDVVQEATFSNNTTFGITDNTIVTSDIEVSGQTGVVLDVNVEVNITHTFNADLDVFLVAPDGTRVELFTDVGGAGDNFVGTILDDDAATAITAGSAPFTGTFRPEGLLANFNGLAPNGIWQLEVGDDAGGDVGTLNSWSLVMLAGDVNEPSVTTDPHGDTFMDLTPGSHSMGLVLQEGWSFTLPNDGFIDATASGSPLFSQSFGVRQATLSEITTRGIFYNNATGALLSSSGDASGALDTSKQPLLPGQSSTFANYSNYQRGLNGFLFDITELAAGATEQQVLDSLQFAVWNGIDTAGFVDLPTTAVPSVELVTVAEGTRVKVTFPDGSLMNTWLRTVVTANATTNLASDDVFYFGHVLADVGQGNTATRIRVNPADTIFVRANQRLAANSADASFPYDINRDGRVNPLDTLLVRGNQQLAGIVAPITAPATIRFGGNEVGSGEKKGTASGGNGGVLKFGSVAPETGASLGDMQSRSLPPAPSVVLPSSGLKTQVDTRVRPTNSAAPEQASNVRSSAARKAESDSARKDQVFELLGSGNLTLRIGK